MTNKESLLSTICYYCLSPFFSIYPNSTTIVSLIDLHNLGSDNGRRKRLFWHSSYLSYLDSHTMTLFVECPLYLVSLVAQFPVILRCFRANLPLVRWCLSKFPGRKTARPVSTNSQLSIQNVNKTFVNKKKTCLWPCQKTNCRELTLENVFLA